jgi:hypothetical protein
MEELMKTRGRRWVPAGYHENSQQVLKLVRVKPRREG